MKVEAATMKASELTEKANELESKEKHAKVEKKTSAARLKHAKDFKTRVEKWGQDNIKSTPGRKLRRRTELLDDSETLDSAEDALDNAEDFGAPATGQIRNDKLL